MGLFIFTAIVLTSDTLSEIYFVHNAALIGKLDDSRFLHYWKGS